MKDRAWAFDLLRAAGAACGLFLWMNVVGEWVRGPFDTLAEWVTFPASARLRHAIALVFGAILIANALVRRRPRALRVAGIFGALATTLVAAADLVRFAAAVGRGTVRAPVVVPASAFVILLMGALTWEMAKNAPWPGMSRRVWLGRAAAAIGLLVLLPLVRMFTFGPSRYERHADAAVVFGARAYATGRPSLALADRVDEAVRLYHAGYVKRILMSGAIDRGAGVSEPVVMRDRAIAQGVRPEDIWIDEAGDDTASTVRNAARILGEQGLSSVLVVTHYYHEPRAKMLFDRAHVVAYTVPATMSRRLAKEPYFIAREVAAFYSSFLFE